LECMLAARSRCSWRAYSRMVAAFAAAFVFFSAYALAALLLPEAPGTTVYQKNGTTVDASHSDRGYIMVKQKKTNKKLKCRVSLGGDTMTYDLNSDGGYEVYPLQLGSGKYKVQVFSQVSGSKYSPVSSLSFKAEIADETLPYLYPNQYVNYSKSTLAVQKAAELCAGLDGEREKFDVCYRYVVTHVVYDYIRAIAAGSGQLDGYLPDVDDVYTNNKGICFDFAAILAAMLRSQGVPTKLVIGYADQTYHAWNEVYLDGGWQRCDPTSEVCAVTVKTYTTKRIY